MSNLIKNEQALDLLKKNNQIFIGTCVNVSIRKSQKDNKDIHYALFEIQLETADGAINIYGDLALDTAKNYAKQFGHDDIRKFITQKLAFKIKVNEYTDSNNQQQKVVAAYALKFFDAEGKAVAYSDPSVEGLYKI